MASPSGCSFQVAESRLQGTGLNQGGEPQRRSLGKLQETGLSEVKPVQSTGTPQWTALPRFFPFFSVCCSL